MAPRVGRERQPTLVGRPCGFYLWDGDVVSWCSYASQVEDKELIERPGAMRVDDALAIG